MFWRLEKFNFELKIWDCSNVLNIFIIEVKVIESEKNKNKEI